MMAAAVPMLVMAAAAQDAETLRRREVEMMQTKLKAELDSAMGQMRVVGLSGAAMGPTVKGAPYSAVEVSESNQVLADGTRIHNESRTSVYRDGEGRVRRETPTQITIMDPVAGVSYFLNPKTLTATKANLAMPMIYKRTAAAGSGTGVAAAGGFSTGGMVVATSPNENATFEVRTDKAGAVSVTVNGKPADPAAIKFDHVIVNDGVEPALTVADKMKAELAVSAGVGGILRDRVTAPGKTEALGKQMFEGVNADGTRYTTTLDAGSIGNDRPIQMVNERWYSPELQTTMMTRHSDPRSGEDTFRLINVSRNEPGADLFQVPANYQISDRTPLNDKNR